MKNFILIFTALAGIFFLKVSVKREPIAMNVQIAKTTAYNSSSR